MATYAKNAAKVIPKSYGIIKQGFNEVPELMLAIGLGLVGSGLLLYGGYKADLNEDQHKHFKVRYTVYREGDPRIKYIKDIKLPH